MYTISSDVLLNKTILLVDEWEVPLGQIEFVQKECPVDQCILTKNSSEADTADAILFKTIITPLFAKRPLNQVSVVGQIFVYRYIYLHWSNIIYILFITFQIWILYYLEATCQIELSQPSSLHVFNWTASYRRDSDIVTPYERWVYHNPKITERELDRNYAANKTKKVKNLR